MQLEFTTLESVAARPPLPRLKAHAGCQVEVTELPQEKQRTTIYILERIPVSLF